MKRFKDLYFQDIRKELQDKFEYKNIHQIPKIEKIVLSTSVKEAIVNSKALTYVVEHLKLISGQLPAVTTARKSIAAFKLRQGMKIGAKVTIRKERLFDFLERLVLVAMPRIKNFRGLSTKNFDKNGNLNFGIKEQTIFPEIKYDDVKIESGFNITIVTSSKSIKESKVLLSSFKIPFND